MGPFGPGSGRVGLAVAGRSSPGRVPLTPTTASQEIHTMAYDPPFGPGEGASPFDDIFARFFGGAAPQRPPQRIDIVQLMTEQARELVRDAATQAARWGDPDLDTDHLLWAAARQEPVRRLLTAAGADPDHIARTIEAGAQ